MSADQRPTAAQLWQAVRSELGDVDAWLSDIRHVEGDDRKQALAKANAALDRADVALAILADPKANPETAAGFAATRHAIGDLVFPVRQGLPHGTHFRRYDLRAIADRWHRDVTMPTRRPNRMGMTMDALLAGRSKASSGDAFLSELRGTLHRQRGRASSSGGKA